MSLILECSIYGELLVGIICMYYNYITKKKTLIQEASLL